MNEVINVDVYMNTPTFNPQVEVDLSKVKELIPN
jgi:hypothetical protein